MKNILIVALLIILVASRTHLRNEDPLEACINKFCKGQTIACTKVTTCLPTLSNCGNALQKDMDLNKFDTCLKKSPQAYSLMECALYKCANGNSHHEALEMLINKMN